MVRHRVIKNTTSVARSCLGHWGSRPCALGPEFVFHKEEQKQVHFRAAKNMLVGRKRTGQAVFDKN